MIRLLVGLGNPGPEYERTRHNAGFWWLDAVAHKLGATLRPERAYHALVARVNLPQGTVWLIEPQTFMNLSGKSVAALARFFKILPQEILVAHDELDLPPGTVKMKFGGGHAGHNGLRDIHAQLGSPDYWRLRIGIGHPGVRDEVLSYVLGKPQQEHQQAIDDGIARTFPALEAMWDGNMPRATMLVHAKPAAPKSDDAKRAPPDSVTPKRQRPSAEPSSAPPAGLSTSASTSTSTSQPKPKLDAAPPLGALASALRAAKGENESGS
jgi:PTH1 family peptidyl-tRNA hydrolase